MAKKVVLPLAKARAKLYELADHVASSPDAVVYLEHRGKKERLALVREARLAYLEATVERAQARVTKPFKLAGSLQTTLSDEELEAALAEAKREAARAFDKKLGNVPG
ncbi:MAG: hypothetical protein GEV06_08885 [Luteitalea sp.]|nr:hypothetical protein [Luteitalea sp.]